MEKQNSLKQVLWKYLIVLSTFIIRTRAMPTDIIIKLTVLIWVLKSIISFKREILIREAIKAASIKNSPQATFTAPHRVNHPYTPPLCLEPQSSSRPLWHCFV